jgi:beta-galactosidase
MTTPVTHTSTPVTTHLHNQVLFGAAYYHEYHATPRLDEDLRLMKEAGFSVIRVGESVWANWEPSDGVFELDWMQPILDGAHAAGIKVILGTPTYAVPMWLARQVPEINVERSSGHPMGWGHRQEINYAHPAFKFFAERVIRKIVGRYAAHPAIIGFQVDNEPGNEIFYNRQVFTKFVDHLRDTYGTVDKLNEEWGLTYWSHRLSDWTDLWTPDANVQPQYTLAWRKFQASLTTDFISWQGDVVREYSRADQFVTTCISYERATVEDEVLTRTLDVTAGNPYYRMQDGLALPSTDQPNQAWTSNGTWALFSTADRMYGSKQAPFLVTETDAQAIGMTFSNEPAYDGQWRQAAWALVSRGATMIEYWHWHTLHAGAETYWGGVLPHSLIPGRTYEQIAELGAEFRAAGDKVSELTPYSDVAILFDNASKWMLSEYPALGGPGAASGDISTGDARSYQTVFDSFARGTFEAGLQSNTVHAAQITAINPADYAQAHPVLVAAAFTVADDAQLKWLEQYAAAGGHLIVGIRTGYEDQEARARLEVKPAFLDQAAGLSYDEFSNLNHPIKVEGADWIPEGAQATLWADGLKVDDAEAGTRKTTTTVLATYDHPHFARFPAITTREHGAGRVTYVGTVPNLVLASALMEWAVDVAASTTANTATTKPWRPQNPSQTVSTSTNRHGDTVQIVHNWAWEPTEFVLPAAAEDVLTGEKSKSGSSLTLGAWDVRIFTVTK